MAFMHVGGGEERGEGREREGKKKGREEEREGREEFKWTLTIIMCMKEREEI